MYANVVVVVYQVYLLALLNQLCLLKFFCMHQAGAVYNKDIKPLVAIVILNWNGQKYLQQFLPSVLASTYSNYKVMVADNASSDDSVSFLQKNYPQVAIINNPGNEGFARGYNMALQQIEADIFVLLNSDVEVTPGWIEPIIDLMETDWTIACCQPKLLAWHQKNRFEYAGACGGWIDQLGYPFARGRVFETCEPDDGQYNNAATCFWASGAAMFVRAAVYKELGGLDEYFFAHQEEIDFCWRAQHAGYKVMVQPASVVYHVGGGTLPQGNPRKTFLNFRNNLIMLSKNLPLGEAMIKIPIRFMLDAVVVVKSLLGGDSSTAWAILKAHLHFVKWLIMYRKLAVFPKQKINISSAVYSGSVVWSYFIQKRKTFLEIVGNK